MKGVYSSKSSSVSVKLRQSYLSRFSKLNFFLMICGSEMDYQNQSCAYPCETPYNEICLNLVLICWL